MKKLITNIKPYWNDPVWSKVISAGIIFILGSLITLIWTIVKSLFSNIGLNEIFQNISKFLLFKIYISRFWTLLLVLLFLIFSFKPISLFFKNIYNKIKLKRDQKQIPLQKELPKINVPSRVLFYERMVDAFPGIRELTWFSNPKDAIRRLEILLRPPLKFHSVFKGFDSDPIWWFRGMSSMFIYKFRTIGHNRILLNIYQFKVKKIAAYRGDSYDKDFVYVETIGEPQSGLYNIKETDIKDSIDEFGYSWEEYGLIRHYFFWKKLINRRDYDDGATVIRGKVKNISNAELRIRYLTGYNFIITSKESPYNSQKFETASKDYLNGILTGKYDPDKFFNFLKSFDKFDKNN